MQALAASVPLGLLTFALDFASSEAARSPSLDRAVAALPAVLLEDLLESQVSQHGELGVRSACKRIKHFEVVFHRSLRCIAEVRVISRDYRTAEMIL